MINSVSKLGNVTYGLNLTSQLRILRYVTIVDAGSPDS